MPAVYAQFDEIADALEAHYTDVQDMEFTIESGKLWMLQTRTGKRTGQAAVKHRRRHGARGGDRPTTGRARVEPAQLDQLLHPHDRPRRPGRCGLGKGLAGSPGAASGRHRLRPRRGQALATTARR